MLGKIFHSRRDVVQYVSTLNFSQLHNVPKWTYRFNSFSMLIVCGVFHHAEKYLIGKRIWIHARRACARL